MPKKITIRGEIGWAVGVSDFKNALHEANGDDLIIDWSSPGGVVSTGIEIYNIVKAYPGNITFNIIGVAASMGSYIPLAANKITAEPNAIYMIHNVTMFGGGDHRDLRKRADIVEGLSIMLADGYVKKTGKTKKEIRALMDDETYLFGKQMVKAGFVDELNGDEEPEARQSAIALAKASIDGCIAKLKKESTEDYKHAAAFLAEYKPEHSEAIDKTTKKSNDVDTQENASKSTKPPASADNVKTEDSIMDLVTFRAENPAESALIDKMIADATEAGRVAGRAEMENRIKKTSIAFDPEKSYPKAIQALAKKVLEGAEEPAALTGAITMYDASVEEKKSAEAKAESEELEDTPGGQQDDVKEGLAKTPEDVVALSKRDRGVI